MEEGIRQKRIQTNLRYKNILSQQNDASVNTLFLMVSQRILCTILLISGCFSKLEILNRSKIPIENA